MKSKSTWISVGCVLLAVLLSQFYSIATQDDAAESEMQVVSEVEPILNLPSPTPSAISVHAVPEVVPSATPSPKVVESVPISTNAETPKPPSFILPSSGEVVHPYSDTELVFFEPMREWRCHRGMDFTPFDSEKVVCVAAGTVQKVYKDHLYGTTVTVDHGNGLVSLYGSLKEAAVSEGDQIESGVLIGYMGDTAACESGVHLHFELHKDGTPINPTGL